MRTLFLLAVLLFVAHSAPRAEDAAPPSATGALTSAAASAPGGKVLAAWQDKLKQRLRDELAAGRHPSFTYTPLRSVVAVNALDAKSDLEVSPAKGMVLGAPWAKLTPVDLAALAQALVRKDVGEDHALAAFFLMNAGQADQALKQLALAGELPQAEREVFASLKESKPGVETPGPKPAALSPAEKGDAGATPAKPEPPEDPMVWTPPAERPKFRELLKGEEYQKRLDAALKGVNIKDMEQSKSPVMGIRITEVVPDSPAAELGLTTNDFIVELGGTPVTSFCRQFERLRMPEQPQEMLLSDTAGKTRTVVIPRGPLINDLYPGLPELDPKGVRWQPEEWRLGLFYIRGKNRDARWDREIIAAARQRIDDPDLAETALFHACAAGHPQDYVSDMLGASIARRQGRADATMAFCHFALQAEPDNIPAAAYMLEAAVASYKLEVIQDLMTRYPKLFHEPAKALAECIAAHKALPLAARIAPPPSVAARGLFRDDYLLRAVASPHARFKMEGLLRQGRARFDLSTGIYSTGFFSYLEFGPELQSGEIDLRFRFKPTDQELGSFRKILTLGFCSKDAPAIVNEKVKGNGNGVWINCGVDGVVSTGTAVAIGTSVFDGWPFMKHDLCVDFSRENHLRIVVFAGRAEIFLNEQRVLYTPLPSGIKGLIPWGEVYGMTLEITQFNIWSYVTDPAELKEVKQSINTRYTSGLTRLHRAVIRGDPDEVRTFCEMGADPNIKDDNALTPLYFAKSGKQAKIVEYLLSKGAKADEVAALPANATLLNAAQSGSIETAESLLKAGANINVVDSRGATPLIFAAENGQSKMVAFLLSKGAQADAEQETGWGAIHYAAKNGHSEVIDLLLKAGVPVDVATKAGSTPLMAAAQGGYAKAVEFLLSKGADANHEKKDGENALYWAARYGDTAMADMLLKVGAKIDGDINGVTPLAETANFGNAAMVKFLLNKGAKADAVGVHGNTPLHSAVAGMMANSEAVEMLLKAGAPINSANAFGETPLMWAARSGNAKQVEMLLSKGAEVNFADNKGRTALALAEDRKHPEVAEILRQHGGKMEGPPAPPWQPPAVKPPAPPEPPPGDF